MDFHATLGQFTGWDEALFGWVARHLQVRRKKTEHAPGRVDLTPFLPKLCQLASLAAERAVTVRLVERGPGGIQDGEVLLPRHLDVFADPADNVRLAVVRAMLSGALVAALADHPSARVVSPPWTRWQLLLSLFPPVHARLAADLPGWARALVELGDAWVRVSNTESPTWAHWLAAAELRALGPAPAHGVPPTVPLWGEPPLWTGAQGVPLHAQPDAQDAATTERTSRQRRTPRHVRQLEDRPVSENPMTHAFEKVQTVEAHRGGDKRVDGEDELAEHGDALDAVDLDTVAISSERTQSIYHAEAALVAHDLTPLHGPPATLHYDEWDAARRRYLPGWCHLTLDRAPEDVAAGQALMAEVTTRHRRTLADLQRLFAQLDARRAWHNRQWDGSDVDLPALIDRTAALRAGHDGDERLYVKQRQRGPDLAVYLLMDVSMSTGGWQQGRPLIAVEQEAAMALVWTMDRAQVRLHVGAFHSFGHADCHLVEVAAPTDLPTHTAARLAALQPAGYTRMGPAIRHARTVLATMPERRRLLIVLTDGKPSDVDRYEGRFGEADVRQAARECQQARIDVVGLGVDRASRAPLRAMFGDGHHAVVTHGRDLGAAMTRLVHARLR